MKSRSLVVVVVVFLLKVTFILFEFILMRHVWLSWTVVFYQLFFPDESIRPFNKCKADCSGQTGLSVDKWHKNTVYCILMLMHTAVWTASRG